MSRCCLALLCAAAVALAACDRTPVDPLDPRADVAGMLLGAGDGAVAPLSLPGLIHASIRKVYSEQGSDAARALVADLHRLQEQSRAALAAGDREAAAARTDAAHAEEIAIVLEVLGRDVVRQVGAGVRADAANLESLVEALDSGGRSLPRARELLARINDLLDDAARLATAGRTAAALDAATRAAAAADGVRHAAIEAGRLPALDMLFTEAVAWIHDNRPADEDLQEYDALQRVADSAVRSGDRTRAHAALKAARDEQIELVLRVLGPAAADRLLLALERGLQDAAPALLSARQSGRDVYRLERMVDAARDLRARAAAARDAGDAATAIDLGSHAANLLNAVRIALAVG